MTTPALHPDFRAFIASLRRTGVRFVVVGAHAMTILGRARQTDDLDVLIERTPENAAALGNALRDFGGFDAIATAAEQQLAEPNRMLTIGKKPVAIDILNQISGVAFEDAWAGRVEVSVDGERTPFLGLTQFVANKRAAGRTKDLQDLELLREAGVEIPD